MVLKRTEKCEGNNKAASRCFPSTLPYFVNVPARNKFPKSSKDKILRENQENELFLSTLKYDIT
ncbi:hypothetical protein TcasGA2_TC002549 [Tribolium castaneum]|uniref:Uncharacterized protein n=1 Tax=Tribolium castaneum TaxID=7070 RepID=D6WFY9_TRICA|nr:hypothetical protein TcasGA2_TC002549 [Tribolium castaneum]